MTTIGRDCDLSGGCCKQTTCTASSALQMPRDDLNQQRFSFTSATTDAAAARQPTPPPRSPCRHQRHAACWTSKQEQQKTCDGIPDTTLPATHTRVSDTHASHCVASDGNTRLTRGKVTRQKARGTGNNSHTHVIHVEHFPRGLRNCSFFGFRRDPGRKVAVSERGVTNNINEKAKAVAKLGGCTRCIRRRQILRLPSEKHRVVGWGWGGATFNNKDLNAMESRYDQISEL